MPSWARISKIVEFTIEFPCRVRHAPLGVAPWLSFHDLVFAILHRKENARALIDSVAVLLCKIVDTLACRDLSFAQEGLANGLAEFRRTGTRLLQRHGDHPLQHLERIIG